MADDFEIDFYGDAGDDLPPQQDNHATDSRDYHGDDDDNRRDDHGHDRDQSHEHRRESDADRHDQPHDSTSYHGVKRKSETDDRPVDHNATSAIMISELNWWTTDDDIRGWLVRAGCEDEVKELTFSEHKVNGKSKG